MPSVCVMDFINLNFVIIIVELCEVISDCNCYDFCKSVRAVCVYI